MPVRGTKPKENKRHRNVSAVDWVEIEDVPFTGKVPVKLPAKRLIGDDAAPILGVTKSWWASLRRMPHCALWSESDWHFALATALVADLAFRGVSSASTELRQREQILGTTLDARRDLRIRYVDAVSEKTEPVVPASVADLAERRGRLSSAS